MGGWLSCLGECEMPFQSTVVWRSLYLHDLIFVRWKRLCLGSGGRPTRGVAKSPDTPLATTVDEHGIFAIFTHDRIVA